MGVCELDVNRARARQGKALVSRGRKPVQLIFANPVSYPSTRNRYHPKGATLSEYFFSFCQCFYYASMSDDENENLVKIYYSYNSNIASARRWRTIWNLLGCPESVFLSQTCFLQHLYTNEKSSLWNIAVFISSEQNGSYVIRQNNIKQKTLRVYYFLIKRKKLSGQPSIQISLSSNF